MNRGEDGVGGRWGEDSYLLRLLQVSRCRTEGERCTQDTSLQSLQLLTRLHFTNYDGITLYRLNCKFFRKIDKPGYSVEPYLRRGQHSQAQAFVCIVCVNMYARMYACMYARMPACEGERLMLGIFLFCLISRKGFS